MPGIISLTLSSSAEEVVVELEAMLLLHRLDEALELLVVDAAHLERGTAAQVEENAFVDEVPVCREEVVQRLSAGVWCRYCRPCFRLVHGVPGLADSDALLPRGGDRSEASGDAADESRDRLTRDAHRALTA
jgi:hypothetical protein